MNDVECPNLEALSDHDLAEHEAVFFILGEFCALTHRARFARLAGSIETALKLERDADKKYQQLPENLRW
jgi:hypothetical protein